jgi:uncharacterized protein (UPF0335 family)
MSEPTIGDNSQLKAIVERIEHVEVEIKDLQTGKSEIYQEAKSHGYDVKVLRKVIALRKMDPAARSEVETLMETYLHALETA